jgi:DHA1 family bicyclomycin/chloramphenicol resistance-like MFS transporter
VLGLVMAMGPLAVDMYLPALPTLATEFGTSAARVQHTLSAYLLGLALGQLLFGPIADRHGRKLPLLGGIAAEHFGWYFGAGAASFITMAQLNRRLVTRHGTRRVLGWGVTGVAAAALVLLICAASGFLGFAGVFVPIFVLIGAIGLIASNASSIAMSPFGERAGVASSLLGATQSAFGVLASAAVGWIGNHGPVPMATVMFVCAALSFLTYVFFVRERSR